MMRKLAKFLAIVVAAPLFISGARAQVTPTFQEAQAKAGKATYDEACASCHGTELNNGEFGPQLRGDEFLIRWGGRPLEELYFHMADRMPTAAPGSLSPEQYTNVLAYMLQRNLIQSGTQQLSAALMKQMTLPTSSTFTGVLAAGVQLPPNPNARPSPLAKIRPVTEEMLISPAPGDWLNWRRTVDGQGFSPLKKINKTNVRGLRSVWAWTMPPGPNEGTPLVYDGVMFVQAFGDTVQALDAATGDLLWQYTYRLPKDAPPRVKKTLAILGDRLFVPTSDAHVVALDVKTGRVDWDVAVDSDKGYTILGGPIIAKGNVIVGTRGPRASVVALNANTGEEAWRFLTIPKPGDLGGDTWNGVPYDKRSGGSIWTPGTYDPVENLVFFGPAPTYDTGPLLVRKPGLSNDALFTNATLALNPSTGKLVWHFGHLPNDQLDMDWAFERQIITLGQGKSERRAVVTAGKIAIHDVVDAHTGKYIFSVDLGLQNVVTAIDPKTGAKTINPDVAPGGTTKYVCPGASGGKNFTPSGYNPVTRTLFVPYADACMDLIPVKPGEFGLLSSGVRHAVRPPNKSDGLYGRLQAINLETRKTSWIVRERTPVMTGTLPTAGGLVFAGSVDRTFSAYDDETGQKLWSTRLNDVPNSNPISYEVNGKQYVAVMVGGGGFHAADYDNLLPEVKNPPTRTSEIWVFELPQ